MEIVLNLKLVNFKSKNEVKYFCGSMLDAIDAHFGKYFPCAFGSQPIHLTASSEISSAGNFTEKTILLSREIAFLTRSDKIFMFAFRNFGLQNSNIIRYENIRD